MMGDPTYKSTIDCFVKTLKNDVSSLSFYQRFPMLLFLSKYTGLAASSTGEWWRSWGTTSRSWSNLHSRAHFTIREDTTFKQKTLLVLSHFILVSRRLSIFYEPQPGPKSLDIMEEIFDIGGLVQFASSSCSQLICVLKSNPVIYNRDTEDAFIY